MQTNEEKICTFTQNGTRLQLLRLRPVDYSLEKYQVRLNRKVVKTSISEYEMRKLFAMMAQNIVLQLKIY